MARSAAWTVKEGDTAWGGEGEEWQVRAWVGSCTDTNQVASTGFAYRLVENTLAGF